MKMVPLSGIFTLVSILGFTLFSIFTFYGKMDKTWGFTMMVFFFICVVAAYASIYPDFHKDKESHKTLKHHLDNDEILKKLRQKKNK